MGFISLVRTALTVAVCVSAPRLWPSCCFHSYGMESRSAEAASAPVELPAPHEDGNSHEKARSEAQSEGRRCCPRCGAAVFQMEDVRFCHNCGASVPGARPGWLRFCQRGRIMSAGGSAPFILSLLWAQGHAGGPVLYRRAEGRFLRPVPEKTDGPPWHPITRTGTLKTGVTASASAARRARRRTHTRVS